MPQHAAAPAAPAAPLLADGGARSLPGTEASRRLLAPEGDARPLTLWGSSSMSSEGGDAATPLTVRIHEHLALALAPAVVHAYGVGATRSPHTVLMRGLDTPHLALLGDPAPGTGQVPVELDSGLTPAGPLRIPGDLSGVPGMLDGSSGSWLFAPDDPAASLEAGTFRSSLATVAEGSRQVLWMGKNNIHQVERVLEDTQRMWDAAADPEHDTLVLGQWATPSDPVGSATAEAVAQVSAEQQRRYGDHFLDLGELLTSESGLSCPPLAPLRLLEQATTHAALEQGIVPADLRAPDDIHLNGWGNLAVSWAIVRRLRELRWL
ncbi:hypothetical protein CFK41_00525 [Brachybacterium ginsengisoli]|uniref:SGNH hydrolase-type esterase domain-containing protein n=1 Tax=Brachybacterium ginsengisoli TaxID=1331682 RepID=A0A291GT85_9MICO|nr:hypothetical protein [Brachybacterium ginsengisoli]ATG53425.1 hypothetical protein CFK41_00525 [Brachybacterium ginsengisoli]